MVNNIATNIAIRFNEKKYKTLLLTGHNFHYWCNILNTENLYDGILEKTLVQHKKYSNFYISSYSKKYDGTYDSDFSEYDFIKILPILDYFRRKFDYILVNLNVVFQGSFSISISKEADINIIVTQPQAAAVRDADKTIGDLQNAGVKNLKYIVNFLSDPEEDLTLKDVNELLDTDTVEYIGVVPSKCKKNFFLTLDKFGN